MRRAFSVVLSFLILIAPVYQSFAQSMRAGLPTQESSGPSTSFRGGGGVAGGLRQSGSQPGAPLNMQPPGIGGTSMGAVSEASAMMGSGYQIHILGEVVQPGTYFVTASTRLLEAIQRAGGFAQNASERQIELRRKNAGTKYIDLLSFKLMGKLDENPYLMDNDVVFIPLRNKAVQVAGAVKRPGMYELKNEKSLMDVVSLAGDFNAATAMSDPIRVIRFKNGEKTVEEVPITKESTSKFSIDNGDVVFVPSLLTKNTEFDYNVAAIPGEQPFYPSYEDRVFVLGGVAFPGAYPFSPYYSLNQYVSLAGGLTDRGAPKYSLISIDGKKRHAKESIHVNPGDTIMVKERWMSPPNWMNFMMSIASFGLSTSSTVLALTRR